MKHIIGVVEQKRSWVSIEELRQFYAEESVAEVKVILWRRGKDYAEIPLADLKRADKIFRRHLAKEVQGRDNKDKPPLIHWADCILFQHNGHPNGEFA